MMNLSRFRILLLLLLPMAVVPAARAQMAVFDSATLGQLGSEYKTLSQQLGVQQSYLLAMIGTRGMQLLLAGTQRNYLPVNYSSLAAVAAGGGGYGGLGGEVLGAQRGLTVLSAAQLDGLSPTAGQQVVAQRQSIALLQAITQTALSNSSSRFASLQQLIDTIGKTQDPKASLDLQARIAAEQSMLQNEQTKLQVLYVGALAQHWADGQRAREQVVAAHGSFGARFQPAP